MSVLALEKPYPTYALPPLVRNAIIETQKNTQYKALIKALIYLYFKIFI